LAGSAQEGRGSPAYSNEARSYDLIGYAREPPGPRRNPLKKAVLRIRNQCRFLPSFLSSWVRGEILAAAPFGAFPDLRRLVRSEPRLCRRALYLYAVFFDGRRCACLGISAFYHDSAAALVCATAKIIAAAQEERFTARNTTLVFPPTQIAYCLKEAKIDAGGVDRIVFLRKPFLNSNV